MVWLVLLSGTEYLIVLTLKCMIIFISRVIYYALCCAACIYVFVLIIFVCVYFLGEDRMRYVEITPEALTHSHDLYRDRPSKAQLSASPAGEGRSALSLTLVALSIYSLFVSNSFHCLTE